MMLQISECSVRTSSRFSSAVSVFRRTFPRPFRKNPARKLHLDDFVLRTVAPLGPRRAEIVSLRFPRLLHCGITFGMIYATTAMWSQSSRCVFYQDPLCCLFSFSSPNVSQDSPLQVPQRCRHRDSTLKPSAVSITRPNSRIHAFVPDCAWLSRGKVKVTAGSGDSTPESAVATDCRSHVEPSWNHQQFSKH